MAAEPFYLFLFFKVLLSLQATALASPRNILPDMTHLHTAAVKASAESAQASAVCRCHYWWLHHGQAQTCTMRRR
jgi:hypothetical protein